jgi:hypothetical protein
MDPVNVMADALRRAGAMMTSDSRDWARDRSDVWLYGLLVGWECEEQHEHDEVCGGDDGLREVAALHGWDEETVARLRRYRAAIAAVTAQPGGIITVDKQLTDAEAAELAERWEASFRRPGVVRTPEIIVPSGEPFRGYLTAAMKPRPRW